jgi:hypothetical protein
MKDTVAKLKNNPMGVVLGAGAGFLVAKQLIKTEKMWVVIATAVVGGVAGAMVQASMKAKGSQPTASTVAATK